MKIDLAVNCGKTKPISKCRRKGAGEKTCAGKFFAVMGRRHKVLNPRARRLQCLIPAFYYFSEPEAWSSEAGPTGSSPAIREAGSAILDISVEYSG